MPNWVIPYAAFPFVITTDSSTASAPLGGFSSISGLPAAWQAAEYRGGPSGLAHPIRVVGQYKVGTITLKRGVVNAGGLADWLGAARSGVGKAKRAATIVLRDDTRQPIQTWSLAGASPISWMGPSLSGKGGGDVAIEHLILQVERIEISGR